MNTHTLQRPTSSTFKLAWRRLLTSAWTTLEANGRDRARRHLLDYAHQTESTRPELARELRAAGAALVGPGTRSPVAVDR